jgi:hypothetical protein
MKLAPLRRPLPATTESKGMREATGIASVHSRTLGGIM